MNQSAIHAVMTKVRNCALVLLRNASYIQIELANVRIDDDLRTQTEEVCAALIGTKHDIISELVELDELVNSEEPSSVVTSRLNRILQWLRDDVTRMHQVLMSLESASKRDPECIGAYVLVAESATNILDAVNRAWAATDSLHAGVDEH